MQKLRIIAQSDHFVAVDKPAGLQVHPPEGGQIRIKTHCVQILRKQLGVPIFPVHRLDRSTSGVLVFALNSPAAARLQEQFRNQQVHKEYFAMIRGWAQDRDRIEGSDGGITDYETCFRIEVPGTIAGTSHATVRASLVRVFPLTGKTHQIRRHFKHISHPLIGDRVYGDGKHNRFWAEKLGERDLFLKSYAVTFQDPETGRRQKFHSRWGRAWHSVFDLFGACPISLN